MSAPADTAPRRVRRWPRRLAAAVVAVPVLALLLLQVEAIRTPVINRALRAAGPWEDMVLRAGATQGTVVGSLGLSDVTLVRADGSRAVSIDSVGLDWTLPALLRRHLVLHSVTIRSPRIDARRDTAGAVDVLAPFAASDRPADAEPSAWRTTIDRLLLSDGSVRIRPDSGVAWEAGSVLLRLGDLRTGDGLALRIDTLGLTIPDSAAGLPGSLAAVGSLDPDGLHMDTLAFRTARSLVTGSGSLRLPGADAVWPDTLDLDLTAAPLALADLAPLVPSLDPGGVLYVSATGRGTAGRLDVTARIRQENGGTADLNASMRTDADPVGWRGELDVDALRLDGLLRDRAPGDELSLEAALDLAGTDAAHLSGRVTVDARRLALSGLVEGSARLTQNWTDGRAETRVEATTDRGGGEIEGWIEPFSEPPSWDLRLTSSRMDLPDGPVPFSGILQARAAGSGWTADARVDAHLAIRGGRAGGCDLGEPEASIRLRDGAATVSARAEPCGAPVTLDGRLDLSEDRRWHVDRLALVDVPVSRLLGDTLDSHVQAVLEGSGRLSASGVPAGTLRLAAGPSRWSPWTLDTLAAAIDFSGTDWYARARGRFGDGTFAADVGGSGPSVRIDGVRVEAVDLAAASGGAMPSTDLTLRLDGTVEGWASGSPRARLQARMDRSRIREQRIDSARADLALGDGSGRLGFTARLEGGSIAATADARFDADTLRVEAVDVRFDGLDAAAWTGSAYGTDVSGIATAALARAGGRWTGEGTVTLAPGSRLLRATVDDARARFRLGPDSTSGTLDARLASGRLAARFATRTGGTLSLFLSGDSLDVASLLQADTVRSRLDFRLDLAEVRPDAAAPGGRWSGTASGFWEGVTMARLETRGHLADRTAVVDTLDLDASFGTLRASGSLPLPGSDGPEGGGAATLRGAWTLGDLSGLTGALDRPAVTVMGGSGRFELAGAGRNLLLSVRADLDGLSVFPYYVTSARATLSGEFTPSWKPDGVELSVETGTVVLPAGAADEAQAVLTLAGDSVRVDGSIRLSERLEAAASVISDRQLQTVTVQALDARVDEAEWSLVAPFDVDLRDGLVVSGAVWQAGDQRITLGGGLRAGSGDLFATAASVRLDAVAEWLGYTGLGLTVGGAVAGTGPAAERQLNGMVSAAIRRAGTPVVDVEVAASGGTSALQLDASVTHLRGGSATVRGEAGLVGSGLDDAPLNLEADLSELALDWILPFLDRELVSRLEGRISGQVALRGTFQEPDLDGRLTVRAGAIALPTLGRPKAPLTYSDIEGDLRLEGSRVHMDRLVLHSGVGSMTVTGAIDLERLTLGRFDLDVRANEFLAIDAPTRRAWINASLSLVGTTEAPSLSGRVRVTRGDFRMTDERSADAFEPVDLSPRDLLVLQQRFGIRIGAADTTQFGFYERLSIESLRIDFERDVWVRSRQNPKMDIRFTGGLDVSKDPVDEPVVFGTITVAPERSRIEQFGRTFNIERGELRFSGAMMEPEVDLVGTYTVKSRDSGGEEVSIRLLVSGKPDNLKVEFESEPAMDLSDIVSYIATGRPASSSLQFGSSSGSTYLGSAAGLAIGPVAALVEDLASAGLGLDVVEIEQNGLKGVTLTAGKYLSPEMYVSVQQPVSFTSGTDGTDIEQSSETEVTMDYEILRSLLLSVLSRGGIVRLQLRWEYSF